MIFGLLAIYTAMVFVGFVGSRRSAFFLGALFALSYHGVWFSQNARGYSGLMFFTMVPLALFYLGWHGKAWAWPWYAVAVALGMYVNLNMIVVPATHATILGVEAFSRGRLWRRAAPGAASTGWSALVGAGVLTFFLYGPALPQMAAYYVNLLRLGTADPCPVRDEPLPFPSPGDTPVLGALIAGLTADPALTTVSIATVALGLIGVVSYARSNRLALAMFVLPGIWGIPLALIARSAAQPRYFIYLLPIALVLAVRGIDSIRKSWRPWLVGALIVLSVASLANLYRYPKQDLTGGLSYVAERAKPEASIAAVGLVARAYEIYYAPGIPSGGIARWSGMTLRRPSLVRPPRRGRHWTSGGKNHPRDN